MSELFPKAQKNKLGYNLKQVDEFLEKARTAFGQLESGTTDLTSAQIRTQAFNLVKQGYDLAKVDEALERLETVFYQKEVDREITADGLSAWKEKRTARLEEVQERLKRPVGKKFQNAGFLKQGYLKSEVDKFADRIVKYFDGDEEIRVEDVRKIAFRLKSGGYQEAQVDAVLDAVIELILTADR